jgi:precorrin-6Y C5,15-methyltransferase (decarboxylating)
VPDGGGRRRITVLGIGHGATERGGPLAECVAAADLVVGGRRHLEAVGANGASVVIGGDLGPVLDAIAAADGQVCVLASGDPGFFGIVRALAERFGPDTLDVHPAPSSVAVAFARLGLPWDDALVVSAHGRPVEAAAREVAVATKGAVLTSPDSPPQAVGRELLALGSRHRAVVCSRLGEHDEAVEAVHLEALATGRWDPCSVVVLLAPESEGVAGEKVLAWGRPAERFAHRRGLVTKGEVRAVALGKLGVPAAGVLWDVGAGSGSVAVECASLAPNLSVIAVEQDPEACDRIRANASAWGVVLDVVAGRAPAALAGLPDPDRVFVGGGGLDVLDEVLTRLRPGGRVVATYAALDRAASAFDRLGHLCQVNVSRGERLPDGGLRLVAANPVFVVWGPDE